MKARQTILLTLLCCAVLATTAGAQVLIVPFQVQADGDGNFAYTAEMYYPASGAYFGGYSIINVENIGGSTWIDGFCISWVEGGSHGTYEVTGTLEDPTIGGIVDFEWFYCDPFGGDTKRTLILPPTVGSEDQTWSTIKQMYR